MSTNLKTTKITLTVLFLSVICFLCSAFCYTAYAGVPHLINYQGRLTDKAGKPLAGEHDVTFRIYDAEAKDTGNLLWEEIYSSRIQGSSGLTIEKGIFSTSLGRLNNGNGQKSELKDLAFDKPYFLEIKVDDEVMSPRQQITSAGYAIRAERADSLAIPAEQGDILYYNGSAWTKLPAGTPGNILVTQGAGSSPQWAMPTFSHTQSFTSSGTWAKPAGVSKVLVKVMGAGGASSGNAAANQRASGGGAGGYVEKICTVTGDVTVTVGKGGVGRPNFNSMGDNGGDSSFGSFCTGGGGQGGQSASTPGKGGTTSGGDLSIPGSNGVYGNDATIVGRTPSCFGFSYGYGGGDNGTNGGDGIVIVYW